MDEEVHEFGNFAQSQDIAERNMESNFVHPYVAQMDVIDPQANPWMRPTLPYHYNMDIPYYGYDNNGAALYNVAQKGDIFNDEVRPDVYTTVKKMINPFPLWR